MRKRRGGNWAWVRCQDVNSERSRLDVEPTGPCDCRVLSGRIVRRGAGRHGAGDTHDVDDRTVRCQEARPRSRGDTHHGEVEQIDGPRRFVRIVLDQWCAKRTTGVVDQEADPRLLRESS